MSHAVWAFALLALASPRCSPDPATPVAETSPRETPNVSTDSPPPETDPASAQQGAPGNETPEALEATLRTMAASGDPVELAKLEQRLGDPAVLERLDPPVDGYRPMRRLLAVFDTLAAHPSQGTEALGQALLRDEDFVSVPQRLPPLYRALAAVVPTSEATAATFRAAITAGFHQTLAPNLAANASPRALEVLADLVRDANLAIEDRVEAVHRALLPNRTTPAVLDMCAALLRSNAEPQIQLAVIESLFDDQPRRWFGMVADPPRPPAWSTLPPRGREVLVDLGKTALRRKDLPDELRGAIKNTLAEVQRADPQAD